MIEEWLVSEDQELIVRKPAGGATSGKYVEKRKIPPAISEVVVFIAIPFRNGSEAE